MDIKAEKPIIIGGGLAGLSAAYHCGGEIFEANDQAGGTCRSPKIGGFTFDLGIHVLHTKNTYVLHLLSQELGVEFFEKNRSALIHSHGQQTLYPFQANTYGLPLPVVRDCLVGFIENYCQRKIVGDRSVQNYEEWIKAAFGEGIAEHFMVPYSEKFWTVSPREMTTDWLDVRIPMPELKEVIEGALGRQEKGFGPNALFRYPREMGIEALPAAFTKHGVVVHCNKELVSLNLERKSLAFSDGSSCSYKALILTIPLPELLHITNLPAEIRDAVQRLKYNSICCVNLKVKRGNINPNHWIYYPENDFSFFRISFPENFAGYTVPAGYSSISAEIAYSLDKPLDGDNIVDRVRDDLIRAEVISPEDEVECLDLQKIEYGYVIFDHERKRNVEIIKEFFVQHDVILAGRYGSWEYQWMDDAILDGKRAAEQAVNCL